MKALRAALMLGCAIVLASCGGSDQKPAGKGTAAEADKFVEDINAGKNFRTGKPQRGYSRPTSPPTRSSSIRAPAKNI
jgi:hypothetical protein